MANQISKRNAKNEAAAYVRSLVSEGYIIRVMHNDDSSDFGYCSLKHTMNRNVIHVYTYPLRWCVYKNGFCIKDESWD